jgi:hypothetical protein
MMSPPICSRLARGKALSAFFGPTRAFSHLTRSPNLPAITAIGAFYQRRLRQVSGVHRTYRADPEGQQSVDLTRSPSRRPLTGVCAKRTLSETPRYSSRFGSKPVQPDRVLTLKRTDIDENAFVLNKRAKSRPQLAAVSEQGGAYSPVAFFVRARCGPPPPSSSGSRLRSRGRRPMWRKRPASSRGRQTGSSALPDSLRPVCFMCGSEHERNSDSSSIFGKNKTLS